MQSILATLRTNNGAAEETETGEQAAARRRRKYIPADMEHIIIG